MEYRKTKRKGIQPKPCSESELLTLYKFDNINCIFRELDEKGDWVFPILDMEINPNDHHVEAGRGIYYPINPEAETLIYNSMLSLV